MFATWVVLIPNMPTRALFFSAGGIICFASGGYDTFQVVRTLELWHGEAGVYIQAEYFTFGLGTFVVPLLMKPFLAQEHACLKKQRMVPEIRLYTQKNDWARKQKLICIFQR